MLTEATREDVLDRLAVGNEDFRELLFHSADLSNLFLSHCDFTGSVFSSCTAHGSDFSHVKFRNCKIRHCRFERNIFDNVDFSKSHLSNTCFDFSSMWAAIFDECYLRGAEFKHCDVRGFKTEGAILPWSDHTILSEILRQNAGDLWEVKVFAGYILANRHLCWDDFYWTAKDKMSPVGFRQMFETFWQYAVNDHKNNLPMLLSKIFIDEGLMNNED